MKKEIAMNKTVQFSLVNTFLTPIAGVYSRIMGVNFNTTDTLRILQVQVALLLLLLPIKAHEIYYAAMLLWFALSLYKCKYLNNKFKELDD
jgi:hypothetical protein